MFVSTSLSLSLPFLILSFYSCFHLSFNLSLCLSHSSPKPGGSFWSWFNVFFRQCSGQRWVAPGCKSARPVKADSSCRCLRPWLTTPLSHCCLVVTTWTPVLPYGQLQRQTAYWVRERWSGSGGWSDCWILFGYSWGFNIWDVLDLFYFVGDWSMLEGCEVSSGLSSL